MIAEGGGVVIRVCGGKNRQCRPGRCDARSAADDGPVAQWCDSVSASCACAHGGAASARAAVTCRRRQAARARVCVRARARTSALRSCTAVCTAVRARAKYLTRKGERGRSLSVAAREVVVMAEGRGFLGGRSTEKRRGSPRRDNNVIEPGLPELVWMLREGAGGILSEPPRPSVLTRYLSWPAQPRYLSRGSHMGRKGLTRTQPKKQQREDSQLTYRR